MLKFFYEKSSLILARIWVGGKNLVGPENGWSGSWQTWPTLPQPGQWGRSRGSKIVMKPFHSSHLRIQEQETLSSTSWHASNSSDQMRHVPKYFSNSLINRPAVFKKKIRVQGSNYTCCFQSRIISMMPANQLRGERNSLKIGKIFTTSTHTLFRNIQVINWQKCRAWTNTSSIYNEYSLILVQKTKKRRKVLTFFFVVYIKVTWSSVGMVMFSWVNFSCLRLSTQQMGPEPTFDGKCGPKTHEDPWGTEWPFRCLDYL